MTFADRVIAFNQSLEFNEKLPKGISIMNPFQESAYALDISSKFYQKYFDDANPREIIFGINPGRLGSGITGIPFTDTKRMEEFCDMKFDKIHSHEPSSVFIYDLITAFGGVAKFYNSYYISSVCPLGFLIKKANGNQVNFNYYDDGHLQQLMEPFILKTIKQQIAFGVNTERCFVLGNNKNFKYLSQLNAKHNLFGSIIPLEHPRYIMQYKLKQKEAFLEKFIKLLSNP